MRKSSSVPVLIFLLAAVFLVYFNSLNGEFVFDDDHMIGENIFIKNPAYFPLFFKGFTTSHPIAQGMCRPFLMLTFAFNYALGGLNTCGYHLFNVFLHFLNVVLLFFLLRRLNKEAPPTAAFLLALLFAVHPINTEAVTYINGRADLMVCCFALAAFILYLRRKYLFTGLFYVAALMSKETALIMPLVFIGHYFIYIRRPHGLWAQNENDSHENKRFFIILGLITVGYVFWYMRFFYGAAAPDKVYSFFANIIPQSRATFFYLRLFFWPAGLNIMHPGPVVRSLFEPEALLSLAGMAGLSAGVFLLRKRSYTASLGLLWLLIWRAPLFFAKLNFAV
jgi:protein O-mannosyl-transferase